MTDAVENATIAFANSLWLEIRETEYIGQQ